MLLPWGDTGCISIWPVQRKSASVTTCLSGDPQQGPAVTASCLSFGRGVRRPGEVSGALGGLASFPGSAGSPRWDFPSLGASWLCRKKENSEARRGRWHSTGCHPLITMSSSVSLVSLWVAPGGGCGGLPSTGPVTATWWGREALDRG